MYLKPSYGKRSLGVKATKRSMGVGRIFGFLMLFVVSFLMLMPVFFMISTSLKTNTEILRFPPTIIPQEITFNNYLLIFDQIELSTYYINSIIVSVFVVIGTILSSTLVGFGFARYRAPGKKIWFIILLSTLTIPYPAVMVPQFLVFRKLGWIDTFLPLIIPAFMGSAYMIFLLKQFFSTLSNELFDAARIDGCSEFRSFWGIALPLCGPALATVAIFSFLWSWNDLLGPVIYLNSMNKQTLPIALSGMSSRFRITPWNSLMVGAIYAAIPCMILFLFCQRYFVQGIVMTGIK